MKDYSLIIFDYDGVIVDSIGLTVSVMETCSKHLGLDHNPDFEALVRNADNLTREGVQENFVNALNVSEAQFHQWGACVREHMSAGLSNLNMFPGISRLLSKLSDRHTLSIVTGNTEEVVLKVMDQHNLSPFLTSITGAKDGVTKTEQIQHLISIHSIAEERVYYVGDAVSDIRYAKKARVKSIAVTWGYHSRDRLAREDPDIIVDTVEELLDFFAV